MTKVEMTNREFFTKVANNEIDDTVIAKANELIESLDEKNRKRKAKPSKEVEENKKVRASILEYLTGKDFTLGITIAEELGISKNKVSSLLARMEELESTEVSVPKVGKRKAYRVKSV